MQKAIASALKSSGVSFEREVSLSRTDIVDFMVGNVAIECKVKGPATGVIRQVKRYMEHDRVHSLILYTSFHMGLPEKINNKPTSVIKPGMAWL